MLNTAARWSGWMLIAGAALMGVTIVALSVVGNRSLESPLISGPLLLASIMLMLSLPAMYARQADAAGPVGLAGHALLQTGMLLLFAVAEPALRDPQNYRASGENMLDFLLGLALIFGLLLTAVATVRAGVYPRMAGILLLGAGSGMFFVFLVAEFLPPIAGQAGTAFLGVVLALGFARVGAVLLHGFQP